MRVEGLTLNLSNLLPEEIRYCTIPQMI